MGGLLCLLAFAVLDSDRMGGYRVGSDYNRLYRPADVLALSVTVTGMGASAPAPGMEPAATLFVQTVAGGVALVELGPVWAEEPRKLDFRVGDRMVVIGARIHRGDADVILAQRIRKGDAIVLFRNLAGRPLWDLVSADPPEGLGPNPPVDALFVGVSRNANGHILGQFRTASGDSTLDLGPDWLLERQNADLRPGHVRLYLDPSKASVWSAIEWPSQFFLTHPPELVGTR